MISSFRLQPPTPPLCHTKYASDPHLTIETNRCEITLLDSLGDTIQEHQLTSGLRRRNIDQFLPAILETQLTSNLSQRNIDHFSKNRRNTSKSGEFAQDVPADLALEPQLTSGINRGNIDHFLPTIHRDTKCQLVWSRQKGLP